MTVPEKEDSLKKAPINNDTLYHKFEKALNIPDLSVKANPFILACMEITHEYSMEAHRDWQQLYNEKVAEINELRVSETKVREIRDMDAIVKQITDIAIEIIMDRYSTNRENAIRILDKEEGEDFYLDDVIQIVEKIF